eukprot:jgi/Psemu1/39420/gm1.39420_g
MFSSSEMLSLSEILIVTCSCIIAPATMYIMNNQRSRPSKPNKSNDREKANQRLTHELSKLKEKEKEYKKDARQRLKPRQIQDFDDIMESREAADNDHPLNSALWGTLLNACNTRMTGYAAWKELLEWYDSESQQEAYAATMKLKLEGVRLHSGGNIFDYINNFESIYQKGSKIPRFNIRECDAKNTFARNLLDPDLAQLKMELQESQAKMNLVEMVQKLRIRDEELRLNLLADKNDNKLIRPKLYGNVG